jgi:hypothetical protein
MIQLNGKDERVRVWQLQVELVRAPQANRLQ